MALVFVFYWSPFYMSRQTWPLYQSFSQFLSLWIHSTRHRPVSWCFLFYYLKLFCPFYSTDCSHILSIFLSPKRKISSHAFGSFDTLSLRCILMSLTAWIRLFRILTMITVKSRFKVLFWHAFVSCILDTFFLVDMGTFNFTCLLTQLNFNPRKNRLTFTP